ncbi:hypothetical protein Csa_022105 [Cucumis sativus]|nr:hypothetical protein Csa_022105 [Cucumis sativus]
MKKLHSRIRKKAKDIIRKRFGGQHGETYPEFIEWLRKVDNKLSNNISQEIENEDEDGWDKKVFNGSCHNLAQRHQLGRQTKKELNLSIQQGKEFINQFHARHEFELNEVVSN